MSASLGREELAVDELVEGEVQSPPGGGERAVLGDIGGNDGIEERETRSQYAAVRFGEQDGCAATEFSPLVAV
jgi:hypothetical protein